jgi:chromosome segregation ATPase
MTFKPMLVWIVLTAWAFPALHADVPQPADREALVRELTAVQSALALSQTNLVANQKDLWQKQHDLEYGDPEIVSLRKEITALEKQLIQKRKDLQVRLSLKPELKKLEAARKSMFKDIQQLRDQEAAIQREIRVLDNAPALVQPEQ